MTAYVVRMNAPQRGFFVGSFVAPADWPDVLTGPRGEIAVRTHTMRAHSAIYSLSAFGEAIVDAGTEPDLLGTHEAVLILFEADDSVAASIRFAPHPSVGDDVSELVPVGKFNGVSYRPVPMLWESSSAHQTWRMNIGTAAVLFATIRSNSSIVDYALVGRDDGEMVLEFGEPVVGLSDAGIWTDILRGSSMRCDIHRFRVACRSWTDKHPDHHLAELTADEQSMAFRGPWHGAADNFREWLGVDRMTFGVSLDDWIPRNNPNAGGTDPAFGAVVHASEVSAIYIESDLRAADQWGRHPMFPGEWEANPDTGVRYVSPIDPPPSHPDLTTHKCQPWIEEKRGGIGAVDGKHPMDGQHRAMMTPITLYGMTGDPALRFMLDLWLGAEVHDRRRKLGWVGSGREEGRIAYNVCAALELGLGDEVALREYLMARLDVAVASRPASPGPVRPMFVIDRGLPWEGWTPWEEAQAAWGWWRLYSITGRRTALEMAHERGRNVALALGEASDSESFWIPYRVRYYSDGRVPDISPHSADIVSPNFGPDGLFAWSMSGLRAFILATREIGELPTEVHERVIRALRWSDRVGRRHMVDDRMALRGAFHSILS